MVSFAPFVPATGVRRAAPDVTVTLPSPPRQPGDPLVRPGVARHEGATLVMLPLEEDGSGSFPLSSPVTGPCRRVELGTTLPGLPGVTTLLEVSPLPFGIRPALRRLPGLPVFYLGAANAPTPLDDELVRAGETVLTTNRAYVGMLFGDRVAQSPAAWVDLVADAISGVDTVAEETAWRDLTSYAAPGRVLRVLDHVGRPAASYQLRIDGATVATDGSGEVPLPAGEVSVRWMADDLGGPALGPVHARYDTDAAATADRASSTRPGGSLRIPAGSVRPHVQLFDSGRWFAARPAGLDPALGVLHADSRVEPLVDGMPAFALMLEDLRAATGTGCGAHFAGWSFNDFPFDPSDEAGSMFTDLVRDLRGGEGARFLMDRYLVFRDDAPPDGLRKGLVILLVAATDVVILLSVNDVITSDGMGLFAMAAAASAAAMAVGLLGGGTLFGALEDKVDGSHELADVINGIKAGIALRARHPARWDDNPVGQEALLPIDHRDYLDGVGSWHQKFQVIRRTPDALGNRVVGYLGGIDINQNRLDTPGHHGRAWKPSDAASRTPSPRAFHDVHARVTGPAAADVARTFERRWIFDSGRQPAGTPAHSVVFPTPEATDTAEVPPQPARHLVQVGRSGYAPEPGGGGGTPLPWSPTGEATIPQAVIQAIGQATEYIYIEDQYFTPPDEYVSALLDASLREPTMRLVIVMPTASDQIFGDIRRRAMFEVLRDDPNSLRGWGDRMVVAAPVRRPVLADAGRIASRGRLRLLEAITTGSETVVLGPRARVAPDVPFWMWVQGERMLAVEQRDDVVVDGMPGRRFLVRRPFGPERLWGSRLRDHDAGAPVTLAQEHGIYVHTKVVIVDDVFVGIGSCNTNRRGFFHDGEITAFAVPERLKSAPENPALALRTALWAEHLGIPPAMGPALLADPVAATDLFRRPTILGNRMSSFAALGVTPEIGFPGESATLLKMFATFGITVADDLVPYVWNTLADPTSDTELAPASGPGLGTV